MAYPDFVSIASIALQFHYQAISYAFELTISCFDFGVY